MFSDAEVREAWLDAYVLAGKPEGGWQAFVSVAQGVWPRDREQLTEMIRQAFIADPNQREAML
jgi:hypothetical protein